LHIDYTVSINTEAALLAAKERKELFLFVFSVFFRGYSFILPALDICREKNSARDEINLSPKVPVAHLK
jgi:hypothetical protein